MKKIKITAAFLLVLVSALLSGCAHEQEKEAADSTDTAKKDGYEFIFVCPIINNEYWQACIEGIEKADRELGVTTHVIGPAEAASFSTEIVGYMKEAVNASPDGIMAYSGIEATWPYINQAGDNNIPFLSIDSDAPDTNRLAYVGTDSYNSGYLAGETMVSLTKGRAKIGILLTPDAPTNQKKAISGFCDAISDYDMDVVCMEECDADPEAAEATVRTMLLAHPDITGIFGLASYHITGAARVKKADNLTGLKLIGFDDVEENLAFIREGIIDAITVQRPDLMGYRGVYLLNEYMEHGTLSSDFYDTGTILVTADNIDSYKD